MKNRTMRCEMCGQIFDPDAHLACQSCPLNRGCKLVCCPNCGYETVDVGRSKWVGWITHWFHRPGGQRSLHDGLTLADVRPGGDARVSGFSQQISNERRAHLQAYGLVPGRDIHVLQHQPVTIIQVEHIELALEHELAEDVLVEQD